MPMNETLLNKQFFLHQLHHPHPSQQLLKQSFRLRDVTHSIIMPMYKIIAMCIDCAIGHAYCASGCATHGHKRMPCYSHLINLCLAPPWFQFFMNGALIQQNTCSCSMRRQHKAVLSCATNMVLQYF